jgi:hypothetical protein
MVDEVDADAAMAVRGNGDFHFGANRVSARDQNRLVVTRG